MKAVLKDLGTMEYRSCWELQQELFRAMVEGKRAGSATGRTGSPEPAGPAESEDGKSAEDREDRQPAKGLEDRKSDPAREDLQSREARPLPATPTAARTEARAAAPETFGEQAGTILLVEHPPVYTLGKSGHAENLLVRREALEGMGARFFHIDRGGDITFHGPGQLVCYPILDLEKLGIGLKDYIAALEEAVIGVAAVYGIAAGRIPGAAGVWVEPEGSRPRKLCAIGVRASRYVTMHGFALNVSTDLGWFTRINPCGFTDRGVTSIEAETGSHPPMQEVKRTVVEVLSRVLRCQIGMAP